MFRTISAASRPFTGTKIIPGDKSISHRALMMATLAIGESFVRGLLPSEDVFATLAAMRAFGADIAEEQDGWRVRGVGIGGLREPDQILNMGNAGTAARLIMGMVTSHPILAFFMGDASLSRRPMGRVIAPLSRMGGLFTAREDKFLPLALQGTRACVPIEYTLPMPSARVKSAILLAGLNTPGTTRIIEPELCRDHTERMLQGFGYPVRVLSQPGGGHVIELDGQGVLHGREISVPADPSSAAFPLVAALLVPGSEVILPNICLNPTRIGLFDTLRDMGADLTYHSERLQGGEPVADILVKYSRLSGVTVPASRAASMIDEYPILSIAAACASGITRMDGLAELKVKESDRLAAIVRGLTDCGIKAEAVDDSLTVYGQETPPGGATINPHLDHRMAMSFAVLGLVSGRPITLTDATCMDTSFPGFWEVMQPVF